MYQAIADTSRFSAIQSERALAVEVNRGSYCLRLSKTRVHRALEFLKWNIALASMYTTKTPVLGEEAIWPFASVLSAQWAYASTHFLSATQSAASSGKMLMWIAIH
jgi:hypothetical protein